VLDELDELELSDDEDDEAEDDSVLVVDVPFELADVLELLPDSRLSVR
jgi:hypothetical protein